MIKTHLSLVLVDSFFAIHLSKIIIIIKKSHNPYFNRWFSAIHLKDFEHTNLLCHNPYFNRWFSAMFGMLVHTKVKSKSQSLF